MCWIWPVSTRTFGTVAQFSVYWETLVIFPLLYPFLVRCWVRIFFLLLEVKEKAEMPDRVTLTKDSEAVFRANCVASRVLVNVFQEVH